MVVLSGSTAEVAAELFLDQELPPGLKPTLILKANAALKRRYSTSEARLFPPWGELLAFFRTLVDRALSERMAEPRLFQRIKPPL